MTRLRGWLWDMADATVESIGNAAVIVLAGVLLLMPFVVIAGAAYGALSLLAWLVEP